MLRAAYQHSLAAKFAAKICDFFYFCTHKTSINKTLLLSEIIDVFIKKKENEKHFEY
jgi:hypothetical protein